jgi:DNA-binding MurR/RpiR family transcriptional regulator
MAAAASPLLSRLKGAADSLSRNQRLLARYVLANYQSVAFSTISELARDASVSEATVVRFARALQFTGYPDLQKEIRRLVRADLKGTERFRLSDGERNGRQGSLERVWQKEVENLTALREAHDPRALRHAVQLITGAVETLVVGTRSTASLAHHLWFGMDKLALPVTRVTAITTETYDSLGRLDRRACAIVIGFPRYLREQVELLAFAREQGVRTVTITDSVFSPLKGEASLYAPAESATFVAFHSAPLVLVNTLLHELSLVDRARTLEALNRFETVAESRRYFQPA